MDPKQENFENVKKIIAPAGAQVFPNYLKIGDKFAKAFFILSYPRYLSTGWFEEVINLPNLFDISIFINPIDTGTALKNLRKKAGQLESQRNDQADRGLVRDPMLETAMQDVDALRDSLQQSQEKLFDTGVYIVLYADTEDELSRLESKLVSMMEAKLIYIKPALFEQLEGLFSILPTNKDDIRVYSPMNTGPISSFFPFVSEDLTSNQGIMYGINLYNDNLVIFDRFSLENANQVVFAKAGSGKSYATKLEIIRSLMAGIEMVIVIDPENEYQRPHCHAPKVRHSGKLSAGNLATDRPIPPEPGRSPNPVKCPPPEIFPGSGRAIAPRHPAYSAGG